MVIIQVFVVVPFLPGRMHLLSWALSREIIMDRTISSDY